jgi:hypothetical protein
MKDLLLPLNKQALHLLDPPLPLHVDVVGPVHHDLADLRVPEQSLDRTEADDFVGNLIHHLREGRGREDRPLLAKNVHDGPADTQPAVRRPEPLQRVHPVRREQSIAHQSSDPVPVDRRRCHV